MIVSVTNAEMNRAARLSDSKTSTWTDCTRVFALCNIFIVRWQTQLPARSDANLTCFAVSGRRARQIRRFSRFDEILHRESFFFAH